MQQALTPDAPSARRVKYEFYPDTGELVESRPTPNGLGTYMRFHTIRSGKLVQHGSVESANVPPVFLSLSGGVSQPSQDQATPAEASLSDGSVGSILPPRSTPTNSFSSADNSAVGYGNVVAIRHPPQTPPRRTTASLMASPGRPLERSPAVIFDNSSFDGKSVAEMLQDLTARFPGNGRIVLSGFPNDDAAQAAEREKRLKLEDEIHNKYHAQLMKEGQDSFEDSQMMALDCDESMFGGSLGMEDLAVAPGDSDMEIDRPRASTPFTSAYDSFSSTESAPSAGPTATNTFDSVASVLAPFQTGGRAGIQAFITPDNATFGTTGSLPVPDAPNPARISGPPPLRQVDTGASSLSTISPASRVGDDVHRARAVHFPGDVRGGGVTFRGAAMTTVAASRFRSSLSPLSSRDLRAVNEEHRARLKRGLTAARKAPESFEGQGQMLLGRSPLPDDDLNEEEMADVENEGVNGSGMDRSDSLKENVKPPSSRVPLSNLQIATAHASEDEAAAALAGDGAAQGAAFPKTPGSPSKRRRSQPVSDASPMVTRARAKAVGGIPHVELGLDNGSATPRAKPASMGKGKARS